MPGDDVIVIGSGPGGLTAAAYLAACGRQVTVLEQHDLAGGNCQVFRRPRRGYEFDVGLHYIGDCGPRGLIPTVLRGVGLGDRIRFRPLDVEGFDTLIFPDFTFRVPVGWENYRDRLIEQFPNERDGIERCVHVLRRVAADVNDSRGDAFGEMLLEWGLRPLGDLFAECGLSPRVVAVLDHWNGLYAGPPSQTATALHAAVLDHYMKGAFYPEGGGQVIPARLVEVVEALGGEVRTMAPVEQILAEGGHVVGVRLDDGSVLEAPVVVSNADYRRTMLELVDPRHLPDEVRARAEEARWTLPLVCLYVVIDTDITERIPNTNYFVFPTYDVEGAYSRLDAGELGDEPFGVYLAFASRKDPGNPHLCPPGRTNFQIMTLAPRGYAFWGVEGEPARGERYRRAPEYLARKHAITEAMLDAAERAIGSFRDHIVHLEMATPLTQERYTRSTGGTSYGLLHSPEQTGPFRPGYRTEVEGLYLVGASTTSGHGIAGTMAGGVMCAGTVAGRNLMDEIRSGAVLVDPASLPADPDDWDPVDVSRGRALRAKREAGRAARAER